MNSPGRSCPLHYRYRPEVFAGAERWHAETLYVVGGLYGNVESLRQVAAMKRHEEERSGAPVELLFNGDFNWFDHDPASFEEINNTVLAHRALRGNVEAELDAEGDDNGCGCAYPDYVDAAVVERSNAIMRSLRKCAASFPELRRRVATLPMHASVEIGGQLVGVVHGDPESLSGWSFAFEAMPPTRSEPQSETAAAPSHCTSPERITDYFRRAQVHAFASTHTCLPFAQDFKVDGTRRLVINNGAAGMPNFQGTSYGLLTRVSVRPETPADSLYGTSLGAIRFDALPIHYDQAAWLRRFVAHWPEGSAAHTAYFDRITRGPDFNLQQAIRIADASR